MPNAEYFLTLCTDGRRSGLASDTVAAATLDELRSMEQDGTWQMRCAVIMPDHVHLLITLGERLLLGKAVARLKAKTCAVLRAVDAALEWEKDFFDRRVRPDDDRLSLFLYIYLNPYRAKLCRRGERWPWYRCCDIDWAWFKELLDADRPPPEWLA